MKTINFVKSRIYLLFCLCLLASACGGGGGGLSVAPPNGGEILTPDGGDGGGNNGGDVAPPPSIQQLQIAVGGANELGIRLGGVDEAVDIRLDQGGVNVDTNLRRGADLLKSIRADVARIKKVLDDAIISGDIASQGQDLNDLIADFREIESTVLTLVLSLEKGLCSDDSPILDNNTSFRNDGARTGCRPVVRAEDCRGNTPVLDNGRCRALQERDCTGGTPIFENGNCRALLARDCSLSEMFENSACRERVAEDCTGGTPVLGDTGECRARIAEDCPAESPILDGGNCRARVASDCTGNEPIFEDENCRARVASDCTGNTPLLDGGTCREVRESDCRDGQVLDISEKFCRLRVASDCPDAAPILDGGNCRARVASDCLAHEVFSHGNDCRPRVAGDCTGATPVLGADGICRVRVAGDCTGGTPVLDGGNCRPRATGDCTGGTPILDGGNCRARVAGDCTGGTPVLDGGNCRARVAGDCAGNTPILDGRDCRARVAGDCTGNTPVLDGGNCRVRQASDCTGGTPILGTNSECRARVGTDCPANEPVLDGGNCRARIAGDCTGATPVLDGGNCRVRQASDCTGVTSVLDGGNCRARVPDDCRASAPVLDGGFCRARIASDCTGATPVLDSGNCRVRRTSDCTSAAPILDGGNCRVRIASDCTGNTPILDGGNCRVRRASDCTGNTPVFDGRICRTRLARDCTGATPILDGGNCRARVAGDCTGNTPVLDNGGVCRARLASDCTANMLFRGGQCVLRGAGGAGECYRFEVYENGSCRTRVVADCTGDTPVLNKRGECRELQRRDCLGGTQVFYRDGNNIGRCRPRVASDCTGRRQVFDDGYCRRRVASDCTGGAPIFRSGECHAREAADCTGNTPVLDGGECRARIASDCTGNKPILGINQVCRARVAADCTGDTPIFDSRSCRAPRVASECPAETTFRNGRCNLPLAANSVMQGLEGNCPSTHMQVGIDCYEKANLAKILDDERDARVAHCKETGLTRWCAGFTDESISAIKKIAANGCGDGYFYDDAKKTCVPYYADNVNNFPAEIDLPRFSYDSWYFTRDGWGRLYHFQQRRRVESGDFHRCDDGSVLPISEACGEFRTVEYGKNPSLEIMNTEYAYRKGHFGQNTTVGVVSYSNEILRTHEDLSENVITENPPNIDPSKIISYDFIPSNATPLAGIVAGLRNGKGAHGVAPEAKVKYYYGVYYNRSWYKKAIDDGLKIIMTADDDDYQYPFTVYRNFRGAKYRVNIYPNTPAIWSKYAHRNSNRIADIVGDTDSVFVFSTSRTAGRKLGGGTRSPKDGHINFYRCVNNEDENCKADSTRFSILKGRSDLQESYGFTYDEFIVGFSVTANGTTIAVSDLNIPEEEDSRVSGYDEVYPVVYPELEDNWLVVTGLQPEIYKDRLGNPVIHGNGCGLAERWCLTAPGYNIYTTSELGDDAYWNGWRGISETAHVSGALAVLKSAAPELKMAQIRNILLTTATDIGLPGRDGDYGWGLVNIEAGIKHIESMRTHTSNGRFAAQGLNDLRAPLPASLSHLKGRLGKVKVAMQITDNSYYNIPLSDIVRFAPDEAPDIGGFALDMLNTGGGNNAESFGFAETDKIAAPFFAGSSGEVLDLPGDGLRPFAVIDNSTGNLADGNFQQFGFRWRKSGERFGVRAEVSRIEEKGGFMGTDFGMLGSPSGSESAQGRIMLNGKIAQDWEGFAEYERARINGKGVESGGFLQGVSGGDADGWSAGLQRRNILQGGDRLRFSVRQETVLRGGNLLISSPFATGDSSDAFLDKSVQTLSVEDTAVGLSRKPETIFGIGYAFRPWERAELSFGGEYEEKSGAGAISAAFRIGF